MRGTISHHHLQTRIFSIFRRWKEKCGSGRVLGDGAGRETATKIEIEFHLPFLPWSVGEGRNGDVREVSRYRKGKEQNGGGSEV